MDSRGMSLRFTLSKGSATDCHHVLALMKGMAAEYLLTGKAYDTNDLRTLAAKAGIVAAIQPKANRQEHLFFDRYPYRFRHLIENCFLDFKRQRGIARVMSKDWILLLSQWKSAS